MSQRYFFIQDEFIFIVQPSISSTFLARFFVRMSFSSFHLRTYVVKKAAEMTFVRKKHAKNVDEIDTWTEYYKKNLFLRQY